MTALDFAGICYGLEHGPGLSCRIAPSATGLTVNIEGKRPISVGYSSMKVSFSGVDDKYMSFEARNWDKDLKILVPDRKIADRIRESGAPGIFLAELDRMTAKRGRRIAYRWAALGGMAGFVALVVAAVWLGFGPAVSLALRAIPVEWEEEMGKTSASQILAGKQACSDPALGAIVEEIGMRLINGLGASTYGFKFRILASDDVNAFALPGGYVFINRGLIDRADDGAEVAGVLAHEIQHVLNRDGFNNLARQAGMMLVLGAVVGNAGGLQQFMMYNAASLASMSFSREQETKADVGGLELMRRSRLDQTGLPRFLKKLAAEEGNLSKALTIVSSHPASDTRVKELEAMIATDPKPAVVPLKANLAAVRGRCSPVSISDPEAP